MPREAAAVVWRAPVSLNTREGTSNTKICGRDALRILHTMTTNVVTVAVTSPNTFEAGTSVVDPTRLVIIR